MSEEVLKQFMEKISNVQHKYCGVLDENGFRIGTSCQQWFGRSFTQEYSGQFLYNNMQNKGIYLIDKKGDQTYYDGLFFCNKLEGYGKVIYANSTVFEGLFKEHMRFGPGVLTYSNDTQDVGMWDGYTLRRIMVSVGGELFPRLGTTAFGKARLLKFRELVPVCVKVPDIAKDILSQLTNNEEIIAQSDQLYNLHIRNSESLFFNKNLYHANFAREDCTIDVVISQEEFEGFSLRSRGRLDDESVAGEWTENDSFVCSCFQPNLDRFGHLCMQLNEIEVKLQALLEKKDRMKQQLLTCKYCCEHLPWISLQDIDKVKIPRRRRYSDTPDPKKKKSNYEKVLSFASLLHSIHSLPSSQSSQSSDCENDTVVNEPVRNEIELSNILYTTLSLTYDNNACEESVLGALSSSTLPFVKTVMSAHDFPHRVHLSEIGYNLNDAQNLDEYEQMDSVPQYPACTCNEKLIENIHSLQKQLESLIQEEVFCNTIKNQLKNHLDIEFAKLNRTGRADTQFLKKIVITDLLAWNNEEIWTAMLKHCFRHRSSEENVSFTVHDLLVGQRHLFKNPGVYETSCTKFLEGCSEDSETKILSFIRTENVNPDICDVRGNTGVMLAAVQDKTNIIAALVNYGAKLDIMNDEGLTPLTISFLKYITFKFKVSDWEKAFLPETKPVSQDFQQWCPADSLISMYGNLLMNAKKDLTPEQIQSELGNDSFGETLTNGADSEVKESTVSQIDFKTIMMMMTSKSKQQYIFKVDYVYVPHVKPEKEVKQKSASNVKIKTAKTKNDKKKKKNLQKKPEKPSHQKKDNKQSKIDEQIAIKMVAVKNTILTLLNYGSDPNIGEVPLKSIFLAVFADDSELMYGLLKNNADPNAIMPDEDLTALHIVVSLNPTHERLRMCEILINFNADPNIKTSANHWPDVGQQILGKVVNGVPSEGKNALHILCIREDFVNDPENLLALMASFLAFKGCKTNDLYLGHTPLSLAVLRANVNLIEFLLDTRLVDPHHVLGNDMGNALTVLILNRYVSWLPIEVKNVVATALVDNGLNPLNRVGTFENSIAFIEHEQHLAKLEQSLSKVAAKPKKKGQKKEKKKKSKEKSKPLKNVSTPSNIPSTASLKKIYKKSSSGTSQKGKRSASQLKSTEDHIIEMSRKILFQHLQAKAVENLYILVLERLIADPMIVVLTNFFTPQEALNIIPLLFKYGRLSLDKLMFSAIYNFLTFIKIQHNMDPELQEHEIEEIDKILKLKSMKTIKEVPRNANFILPEVDTDVKKYTICYRCLQSEGKILVKCPSCELVYFCSEECNSLSDKFDKYHYCKIPFYQAVSEIIIGLERQPSRLSAMVDMATRMREERLSILKLISLEERKKKLKLKSVRDSIETAQIVKELEELEKERELLNYSGNLWDYGIMPPIGTQSFDHKVAKSASKLSSTRNQKSSQSLHRLSVLSERRFEKEVARKLASADAVRLSVLYSSNLLPQQDPSSKKVAAQRYVDDNKRPKGAVDDSRSSGPSAKPFVNTHQRRRSSSPRGSRTASTNILLPTKSNTLANKPASVSKLLAKTFDVNYPINYIFNETNLGLTPSMIVKREFENIEKKFPDKNYYMELLSKIFADFNLPLLLLPYACYKDGQVYYKMTADNSYFGFHKLKIPD
ncbi:hypothetical protein Zmor_018320 [Zophobas morio]|uniref:Ankyrin repeat and MYND domain-containing protein 1 n=1 Tax=Zophobas morio TaxID=2755281 RepID=A0AA38IAX5_9CUCU|nr:hypothetical protein Zmor_018320 [Zophobas morio]